MRTYEQDKYWEGRAKIARSMLIRKSLARIGGDMISLSDEMWFLQKAAERTADSFAAFSKAWEANAPTN